MQSHEVGHQFDVGVARFVQFAVLVRNDVAGAVVKVIRIETPHANQQQHSQKNDLRPRRNLPDLGTAGTAENDFLFREKRLLFLILHMSRRLVVDYIHTNPSPDTPGQ